MVTRMTVDIERAKRIGGALALDFVNTTESRSAAGGVEGERLVSYESLVRWGGLAGALGQREVRTLSHAASSRPAKASGVLRRAIAVREVMYRVFTAAMDGRTPGTADLDALNRELRIVRAHECLGPGPPFTWRWDPDPTALDRVLWPVVRSAGELLTGPSLHRIRQCPGEACGWLFLDVSRSGRRQWCDMAVCGNLAKVRRFRKRRQERP